RRPRSPRRQPRQCLDPRCDPRRCAAVAGRRRCRGLPEMARPASRSAATYRNIAVPARHGRAGCICCAREMLLPREAPALLSIVIPMYNEEQVLPLLRERLSQLTDELLCRVEVILVDDGSSDATYAMMHEWAASDPAVKVIALSRN